MATAQIRDLVGDTVDQPLIIAYCGPGTRSGVGVVEEILEALQSVVVNVFPSWLGTPTASSIIDADDAVHQAHAAYGAAGSEAGYIAELARAAATHGTRTPGSWPADVRVAGLLRLLRASYGADDVILTVVSDHDLSADEQDRVWPACEWLARHGDLTVWLPSDVLRGVDRCANIRMGGRPRGPGTLPVPSARPILTVPPCPGRPAPHSAAEQALERALSAAPWAVDRHWNRAVAGLGALAPTIIADVAWPAARVVVEIDGDDHRGVEKYASDRHRDNLLQRHGHIVLRYTNAQVLDDVGAIVEELRVVVGARTPLPEEHPA